MEKVREDLLGLIDNGMKNDLQKIKSLLKVAKERLETREETLQYSLRSINVRREMAQMAQATFSEDQKFINTIWITDFKVFDARQAHDDNCRRCFSRCDDCGMMPVISYEECDTTMEESYSMEQKLHFWIGFSADDIKDTIPDYFEDCIRGLIAEFACSRIKIEIENNSISFKNEAQTILLHNPNRYVRVKKDKNYAGYDIVTKQILESFPIFSMMISLRQMIIDIGFGDYFTWMSWSDDFARCFPSICWNWQSRFLGLENQELNRWPLQTVKQVVDALKGHNDTMFGPCNESDSALDHVRAFVLEESDIWKTKVMTIDSWRRKEVLDKETGLIKRKELDEFIQRKQNKKGGLFG